MKIRKTSIALASVMAAQIIAAPVNVLAKAPETLEHTTPSWVMAQAVNVAETAKEKTYQVQYALVQDGKEDKPSMAAGALVKGGEVVEKDGKFIYKITFTSLNVMGQTGNVDKFYYYDGETRKDAKKLENGQWSFTLDKKLEKTKVAFASSLMPGNAEPDAILKITNWQEVIKDSPAEPGKKEEPSTPKVDEKVEAAKAKLKDTIAKANAIDKSKWDDRVQYALNNAINYASAYVSDANAKEKDLLLKEAQIGYLTVLGVKSSGINVKNLEEGQVTEADYYVSSSFKDIEQYIEKKELVKEGDRIYCIVTLKPVIKGEKATYIEEFNTKYSKENITIETVEVNGKSYPKKVKAHSHSVYGLKIEGIDGKVSFSGREGRLKPDGKQPLAYRWLLDYCQEWTAEKHHQFDASKTKQLTDKLNAGKSLLESTDLNQEKLDTFVQEIISLLHSLTRPDSGKPQPKPDNPKKDDKKDEKKKYQTTRWDVPVRLVKKDGSSSMASGAVSSWATVDEYRGEYTYYLQFKPIDLKGEKGNLTNLFYYDNGRRYQASYHGDNRWSFTLGYKENFQKISVWVDVMDKLMGGEGKGERDAYLDFNWSRASVDRVIDGKVKEAEKKKEDEKKKEEEKKKEDAKKAEQAKKEVEAALKQRQKDVVVNTFKDVSASHWGLDAIAHAYAKGYFTGVSENQFAPERAITRGEFVTILGRKAGISSAAYSGSIFSDVNATAYYAPYVAWAQKSHIVQGIGDGKFDPNRAISREEMAVMLDKFLINRGKSFTSSNAGAFADGADIADWAKDSVKKMAEKGMVNGTGGGNYSPKANFSRAQAAQVLYNMDLKEKK